ncbi:chaplin [Streptomyces sp. NBC_01361]|uniref:chaplin n=1 Tax=Streptomyces sp. NBC_01361 TaxID=2903838 RepID=UPI002E3241CF|nr:chaplin [Streptomyces sp. NBC_01361]
MRQALNLGMVAAAAATSILSLPGSSAFAASGADGQAAGSPGILSGNTVQAPLDIPVNACGNTVDIVAALNPTFGNSCENRGSSKPSSVRGGGSDRAVGGASHGTGDDGYGGGDGMSEGGAHAESDAHGSPGILSGNSVQAPVHAPVNVCGNSGNVVGAANPATGNHCSSGVATPEEISEVPPPPVRAVEPPAPVQPPTTVQPPAPVQPPTTVQPPATVQPPTTQRLTPPDVTAPVPHAHVTGGHTQLAETGTDQDLLAAAAASAGLLIGGGILYRRGRAAAR